jgi:transglutaminase-like putative cysteine protease
MRLVIRHRTEYRYSRTLAYAIQTLRLSPRTYDGLAVIAWQVRGERLRELPSYVDGLGNLVHSNALNRPHERASIAVEGVVETRAAGGIVRDARETLPPLYYLRATALTAPDDAVARLASESAFGASAMDRLVNLMGAVNGRVAYRQGVTDARTTASQALAKGSGVCQDHAHLFVASCRTLGIPARYVGGYLWSGNSGGEAQASHAWAEAYLDDLGWAGFDPANNALPGESYLRIAIGLDYWQAAPVRGIRRGDAEETLDVAVAITATDSIQ